MAIENVEGDLVTEVDVAPHTELGYAKEVVEFDFDRNQIYYLQLRVEAYSQLVTSKKHHFGKLCCLQQYLVRRTNDYHTFIMQCIMLLNTIISLKTWPGCLFSYLYNFNDLNILTDTSLTYNATTCESFTCPTSKGTRYTVHLIMMDSKK